MQGNLLLDELLGADIRLTLPGIDRDEQMETIAAELRQRGEIPYVIPVGGSNSIGAAGYLTMAIELKEQLANFGAEPSRVYFANGSGGTQAGVTLGVKALGIRCSRNRRPGQLPLPRGEGTHHPHHERGSGTCRERCAGISRRLH